MEHLSALINLMNSDVVCLFHTYRSFNGVAKYSKIYVTISPDIDINVGWEREGVV
jgi:hypothetical protein